MHQKKPNFGTSLVEALVALVVISIGMLGIAGLQVASLRDSKSAVLRTQAVVLASNMSDLIRANIGAASNGNYVTSATAPALNANCEPGGLGCTAAQMASNDTAVWLAQAASTLPNGTGTIARSTATTPATHIITVQWIETSSNGVATGVPQSFVLRMQE